jgi:hypothetical protein
MSDHRLVLLEKFLIAISCILLVIVVVCSVTRPFVEYDSWYYHLPISAKLWNIGNARETFILSDHSAGFYLGFPLLAEFVQGALWWMSGTVAATSLVNSLGLVVFICAAVAATKVSLPILTFGVLSVPLIVLHSISSYIDLFAGILICFQLLAASLLVDRWNLENLDEPTYGWFSIHAFLYIVAAAAAGNTKFMSTIVSLAISGYLLTFVIFLRPAMVLKTKVTLVITIGVATALSLITCARNFREYGNPFFPIAINAFSLPGPHPEYRQYPTYTESLGWLARPVNWILSITQIDWKIRGVKAVYDLSPSTGYFPKRYGPVVTGGLWGAFMMINMGLGVTLFARTARLNRDAFKRHGFLFSSFLIISAVTAFMPQSHELRYYLYWPIFLILIICVLIRCAKLTTLTRLAICGLYFACFLRSEYVLRAPLRVFPSYSPEREIGQKVDSAVIDFARQSGGACLGEPYMPEQLKYSAVFHGGHYVIEQANPDWFVARGYPICSRYTRYIPHHYEVP